MVIVDIVECTLNCPDFFCNEFDDIVSKFIQCVMSAKDFCLLGYTAYNPVALIISPFILNQVITHVNERLAEWFILTSGLEMSIQFSFPYFLVKLTPVFHLLP